MNASTLQTLVERLMLLLLLLLLWPLLLLLLTFPSSSSSSCAWWRWWWWFGQGLIWKLWLTTRSKGSRKETCVLIVVVVCHCRFSLGSNPGQFVKQSRFFRSTTRFGQTRNVLNAVSFFGNKIIFQMHIVKYAIQGLCFCWCWLGSSSPSLSSNWWTTIPPPAAATKTIKTIVKRIRTFPIM